MFLSFAPVVFYRGLIYSAKSTFCHLMFAISESMEGRCVENYLWKILLGPYEILCQSYVYTCMMFQSLSITAALLPSLQAQYKMDQVMSAGVTGSKAKFTIDLAQHSLSFTTKLQVRLLHEAP